MTFDPTKPVQTRDGREARIVATDLDDGDYTIAAVVTNKDGTKTVETFKPDGTFFKVMGQSPTDLVNVPREVTVWVNVFRLTDGDYTLGSAFQSEEIARESGFPDAIKTIPVTFEV